MLPQRVKVKVKTIPSKTYKINWDTGHIADYVDGKDAIKQAIDLHLSTERYLWEIYSWQYGSELNKLLGKSMEYVKVEMPKMIQDALSVDNRIQEIGNFIFEKDHNIIHCTFDVFTSEGVSEMEIDVNA